MKASIPARLVPALLCLSLALGLAACGGQTEPSQTDGDAALLLSGSKSAKSDPAAAGDERAAAEAIALLRTCMEDLDQQACAVAYLGRWEKGDRSSLADWLQTNCAGLAEEMPFLRTIPAERILGGSDGDLFCFVPRDEASTLVVNRVTWASNGAGVWPQNEEVLYRSEYAQPILVFSHYETFRDEPDIEVHVVAQNGADVTWYPEVDDWGIIVLPTDWDGNATMLDFTIFGDTTGLDYPGDWADPPGDGWWLPPTDEGLADTTWVCDRWSLELRRGSGDPAYFGTAELSHQFEDGEEYQRLYTGLWRMTDDCLELKLSAGAGMSTGGCFPVLIDQSGEQLYIQESRDGITPPFFGDDETSKGLTLSYG